MVVIETEEEVSYFEDNHEHKVLTICSPASTEINTIERNLVPNQRKIKNHRIQSTLNKTTLNNSNPEETRKLRSNSYNEF